MFCEACSCTYERIAMEFGDYDRTFEVLLGKVEHKKLFQVCAQ